MQNGINIMNKTNILITGGAGYIGSNVAKELLLNLKNIRIIILDKGKIIAKGTTDELKALAKLEEKITVEVNLPLNISTVCAHQLLLLIPASERVILTLLLQHLVILHNR